MGQPWQEPRTQPRRQRLTLLEGVDHQNHTVGGQRTAALIFEGTGGGTRHAEVNLDDRPARRTRIVGEHPQQGRLARTTGTVDVQHGEARLVVLECGTKQGALSVAADERPHPCRPKPLGKRGSILSKSHAIPR